MVLVYNHLKINIVVFITLELAFYIYSGSQILPCSLLQ